MSAIAGILNIDDGPVDRQRLAAMAERGFCPGHDRQEMVVRGGVGLACRQFNVTPEDRLDRQPAVSADGRDHLVFDGRLDNRAGLALALDLAPASLTVASDAALVLRAYRRWGPDCAVRLLGDFAFALWDGVERRLFCARDAVGVRSFFYTVRSDRLLFASQLDQLLADPEVSSDLDLDREFLADYLVSGGSRNERSPFRNITKLAPAHALTAGREGLRTWRYWEPPRDKLRYRTNDELAEHFLALFEEGIGCLLRSAGPVWSELSGGLDSPAIACVAHRMLARAGERGGRLGTLTVVFDEARESDEREWAQRVVDLYGLDNVHVPGDELYPFKDAAAGARCWDEPHSQLGSYALARRYAELLADAGCRVLLSGCGAEEVLTNEAPEPLHLSDLLRARRWRELGRELSQWQRALDVPMPSLILHSCLEPLLRPQRNYYLKRSNRGVPPWVDAGFARRWRLAERINHPWMPRLFESAADQWQYERIGRMPPALAPGYMGKSFELRYPFLYRPLIEFGLAVPWERKARPGARKPILRRAMRGILPEEVRTRRAKVGAEHCVYLAFAKEWENFAAVLQAPLLAELGVVDRVEFHRAMKRASHGHSEQLAALAWTLALEIWLRAYDATGGRRAADAGDRLQAVAGLGTAAGLA